MRHAVALLILLLAAPAGTGADVDEAGSVRLTAAPRGIFAESIFNTAPAFA